MDAAYRRQPGRLKTRIATRTGMMKARREGIQKKKKGTRLGSGDTSRPGAYTLGDRWAFLCFLVGRFTEHFRPTGFCSSALSGREYQCSWWSLEWAWTGIWDREVRATAVLGFCTIWISLFFSFPPFFHTLHSSYFLETLQVLRFTPSFGVDQRPLLEGGRPATARSHQLSALEYHG